MYAKEIWNFDKTKISLIQNEGYRVLVIWENEYKQNTEKTIQKCIDFLKNDE
jgi:G:T-mismatch repair DNA endonuclease (very short patch repair protein)